MAAATQYPKRYRLGRRIGKGSFGSIYLAVDAEEGKQYAAKLERADSPAAQLPYEARVYRVLEGMRGAPKLHWCGRESGYNVLVLDLLGPSLEDMFNFCGRKFTLKTVCEVGLQMVDLLEETHRRGVMHRDIKPDNFLLGLGSAADQLHIIDFGLAKGWRDGKGDHIPFREGKSLTGTARYCSVPTHRGHEQGRRDDCESVAYVLVYFLKGRLPWQGIRVPSKRRKYAEILRRKESISADELCAGLPGEIPRFVDYTRGLKFDETPDYAHMRGLLETIMKRNKWERDGLCDWVVKNMGDSGRIGEALDAQLLAAHIRRARRRREMEAAEGAKTAAAAAATTAASAGASATAAGATGVVVPAGAGATPGVGLAMAGLEEAVRASDGAGGAHRTGDVERKGDEDDSAVPAAGHRATFDGIATAASSRDFGSHASRAVAGPAGVTAGTSSPLAARSAAGGAGDMFGSPLAASPVNALHGSRVQSTARSTGGRSSDEEGDRREGRSPTAEFGPLPGEDALSPSS